MCKIFKFRVEYLLLVLVAFSVACGATRVKVRKVENLRPDFVDTVGKNNKLFVVSLPAAAMKEEVFGEFLSTGEYVGSREFGSRNYFTVAGTAGPDDRSLAANRNYGAIKKKHNVDTLFTIQQPAQPPTIKCKQKSETRYRDGGCIQWESRYETSQGKTKEIRSCVKFEKVPYEFVTTEISFSGKMTGVLTNLSNGKKISVASKAIGNKQMEGSHCQVNNAGLRNHWADIVREHVTQMVADVSPLAINVAVPVYFTTEGIADTPENEVLLKSTKESLKVSETLTDKGQLEEAAKIWLEIDKATGGKAAAASWNLAVFNWNINNLKAAKTYAEQSFNSGSPDWQERIKEGKDIIDEQHKSLKVKK